MRVAAFTSVSEPIITLSEYSSKWSLLVTTMAIDGAGTIAPRHVRSSLMKAGSAILFMMLSITCLSGCSSLDTWPCLKKIFLALLAE